MILGLTQTTILEQMFVCLFVFIGFTDLHLKKGEKQGRLIGLALRNNSLRNTDLETMIRGPAAL